MNTYFRIALAAVPALLVAAAAGAHHSYAMFDGRATRSLQGTVARFEWQNPHVFLWVYVPSADGVGHELLALESDSVNQLQRLGWRRDRFAAGQPVTVTWYPLRDGRSGGHLVRVDLADGTALDGAPGPINAIALDARRREQP